MVKIAQCIAEKMIVELAIEIQEGSAANRIGLGRTVKRFAKKMGRRMGISTVAKSMVQKFAIRIGTERIAQNSVKCQMISTQENTFATTKRGRRFVRKIGTVQTATYVARSTLKPLSSVMKRREEKFAKRNGMARIVRAIASKTNITCATSRAVKGFVVVSISE